MDFLKKLPVICRQHWEKILLCLVILGLAGSVFYLYEQSQQEKEKIEEYFRQKVRQKVKEVAMVDLSKLETAEKVLQSPPPLNYSTPHNLFNPVKWQRRPDGSLIKIETGKEVGPYALTATEIRPLKLHIGMDRPDNGFMMAVTNEMAPHPSLFRKTFYATAGKTNTFPVTLTNLLAFTLTDPVPPDDPNQWTLELMDSGEKTTISRDKPYSRVQGYVASLRYDPENLPAKTVKVGDKLRLSGENYNIVAITPNEVLLSADSNDRRYSIKFNGSP